MTVSIDELSKAISISFLEDRALAAFVLEVLDKAGYELVPRGQPRQADPSGAASSSTTSEQPADPAAWPKYHGLCYCSSTQTCRYCRDAL